MVQVIRKPVSAMAGSSKSGGRAGKVKSSGKVTVMKGLPKVIPLPFLDD